MTTPAHLEKIGDGVYVAHGEPVVAGPAEIAFLKDTVRQTVRGRVRICAHRSPAAPCQEMLILLLGTTYIRPHLHRGKAESLHVIEGAADAVFFDDAGEVARSVPLGDPGSGRSFYYRIESPLYHTLLLRSEYFLFHEATTGPFVREETLYAPWAPEEGTPTVARYLADLDERVRRRPRPGVR
jgi:cupin fold WbuC family metalloprotein